LAEALTGLTPRDGSLLRYAFGEELTVDMIGRLYGVHKSTASRWVAHAHDELLSSVRAILVERLGISESEYASVLLNIRDSLELSLERYLKDPSP
jgi:RNA polymerase sigma-70 factor, ECF subfamily